ncbi:MAG: AraC family ligand binding domain-containing protein [Christensenellaceae bacterium]
MNSIIDPFERFDLNIMEAGYDSVDSSWHRFVTFFPYYRIYYIVSGHALIYLQDEVLELFPGKMYFIPAFSVFDAHCDEILTHYWIHFNLDTITEKYLTICRPKNQAETLSTDENIFRMVVDSVKKPGKEKSIRDAVASEGLSKYLFSRFLPERKTSPHPRVSVLFRCSNISKKFRPSHHEFGTRSNSLFKSYLFFQSFYKTIRGFSSEIYSPKTAQQRGDSAL